MTMNAFQAFDPSPLIGRPYDRETGNCWHLVRDVMRIVRGEELPDIPVESDSIRHLARLVSSHEEQQKWYRVTTPFHGALVQMSHALAQPYHVGVYLDADGGGVLHCLPQWGVCYDSILTLEAAGWRRIAYYDRVS